MERGIWVLPIHVWPLVESPLGPRSPRRRPYSPSCAPPPASRRGHGGDLRSRPATIRQEMDTGRLRHARLAAGEFSQQSVARRAEASGK